MYVGTEVCSEGRSGSDDENRRLTSMQGMNIMFSCSCCRETIDRRRHDDGS